MDTHLRSLKSAPYTTRHTIPSITKCSETYQRVMKQFRVNRTGAARIRRHLAHVNESSRGQNNMEEVEYLENSDEEPELAQSSRVTKLAAQRGWSLIRRTIDDIAKERKNADASFNWSFLRQHLMHMSDMQRARQELYERYIYKPNTWVDGLSEFPAHLFKKRKRVTDWRGKLITLPTNPRHMLLMKRSKSDVSATKTQNKTTKTRTTVSSLQ